MITSAELMDRYSGAQCSCSPAHTGSAGESAAAPLQDTDSDPEGLERVLLGAAMMLLSSGWNAKAAAPWDRASLQYETQLATQQADLDRRLLESEEESRVDKLRYQSEIAQLRQELHWVVHSKSQLEDKLRKLERTSVQLTDTRHRWK